MNRRIFAGLALVIVGIVGSIVYFFERLSESTGRFTALDPAGRERLRAASV